MILYHCLSARSFRPLWTLEEMGLPYELKVLPFPPPKITQAMIDAVAPYCKGESRDLAHHALEKAFATIRAEEQA